ncbi:MAG: hypothetical protein IPM52_10345 [Bacteroidetes bacterium]|nr:hypothetical protein [Bacteroidota bacterium]
MQKPDPCRNEERQFREYLPELPKKQAVNIEFARGVQPLRITDDLETRLMIAMLFESEPQMGSVSTGSRFSNLISGLGRAINR